MRINVGKNFENKIERSLKDETFCYRLRDSAGAWSKGEEARFTTSNIADYVVYTEGYMFMVECKTTIQKSLPLGNIGASQLKGFNSMRSNPKEGVSGVFIVEFRAIDETYVIDSNKVVEFIKEETRKSIPVKFCRDNGYKLEPKEGRKKKQLRVEDGLIRIAKEREREDKKERKMKIDNIAK